MWTDGLETSFEDCLRGSSFFLSCAAFNEDVFCCAALFKVVDVAAVVAFVAVVDAVADVPKVLRPVAGTLEAVIFLEIVILKKICFEIFEKKI